MNKRSKYLIGLSAAVLIIVVLVILLVNRGPGETAKEEPVVVKKPAVVEKKAPVRAKKVTAPEPKEVKTPPSPDIVREKPPAAAKKKTGVTITGIVKNQQGEPIENATVMTVAYRGGRNISPMAGPSKPENKTNTEGMFEITGLQEESTCDLMVTAKGYGETIEKNVPVGSSDVVIVLPSESTLSGTVFREDTEEPLARINVRLAYQSGSRYEPYQEKRTTSDTEGFYIFRGLGPSQKYVIEAEGSDLISDPVRLTLDEAEERQGVDLYLYPALEITGRVVLTGTDEPVEGVKLRVRGGDSFGLQYGYRDDATSDTEGQFILSGLRAGEYQLRTDHQSKYRMKRNTRGDEEPVKITLEKDRPLDPLIVEVAAGKVILGKVTDEDGQPLKNVNIQAAQIVKSRSYYNWRGHASSKEDGTYQIFGLDADAYEFKVHFSHSQYADVIKDVEFEEDEVEKVVDTALDKGLSISGYVTDSDSEPIEGARIDASSRSRDNIQYRKNTASDTEGYYSIIGTTSGKWKIKAEKSGSIDFAG